METFFPEESPLLADNEKTELPADLKPVAIQNFTKEANVTSQANSTNNNSYSENQTVSLESLLKSDIPVDHKISPLEALLRNQANLQMEALKFKQKSDEEKQAEKELESIPAIEQNISLMNEETQIEEDMLSLQESKLPEELLEDY